MGQSLAKRATDGLTGVIAFADDPNALITVAVQGYEPVYLPTVNFVGVRLVVNFAVEWTVMDMNGNLSTGLDAVYSYLNTHELAFEETEETEEMETETATRYCKCRNRDIPGACTCGKSRDPKEIEFDIVQEPRPKINKISPDVLDIDTPHDPEFAANQRVIVRPGRNNVVIPYADSEASDDDGDDDDDDDDDNFPKFNPAAVRGPLCGPVNGNNPADFGLGQIAEPRVVSFLPFLPPSPPRRHVPPIFRWAAIVNRREGDAPLLTPSQRRQQFQSQLTPVPYSRSVRGREYQARGNYEWSLVLG